MSKDIHRHSQRKRTMGQRISLDAAADELGISKRSLRRLISKGELPAYRIGSLPQVVRVDRDELAAVLQPVVPNGKW
jgi:excisionase family DNA binding protein